MATREQHPNVVGPTLGGPGPGPGPGISGTGTPGTAVPAPPAGGVAARPRPVNRTDRLGVWLLLVICLAAACPPLLLELHRPEVTDADEARTLVTSLHTWSRRHELAGVSDGWVESLLPHYNGRPVPAQPPLPVWMHSLAFQGLNPANPHNTDALILRARLVAVVMALTAVAAVFWAGFSLGGAHNAVFAALVLASSPWFILHGRQASTAIMHTAWMLLSIAAALWAIRPLKPAPTVARQAIGWTICGVTMGAAMLTLGAPALLAVAAPILVILILCPGRLGHTLGLLAALLIGTLVTFPWATYAYSLDPSVWNQWIGQLKPSADLSLADLPRLAFARLGLLLVAVVPWTLWLAGAVAQPFSASSAGSRLRLFVGWSWFILIALLVLLAPTRSIMEPLLVVPAAAVLIGQLFKQYTDLAAEGRHARLWRILTWPHVLVLLLVTLAVPAVLCFQPALIERGWLPIGLFDTWGWPTAAALAAALLVPVILGARWAAQHFPAQALVLWAGWALALTTILMIPLTRGPAAVSDQRPEALRLTEQLGPDRAFWLGSPGQAEGPDPALLLYARRTLPVIQPEQIDAARRNAAPFHVVAPAQASVPEDAVGIDPHGPARHRVWRFDAPPSATP